MSGLELIGSALFGSFAQTMSTLGAVASGVGTVATGVAANKAAKFEAAQMEMKGTEERAAAQREAEQKRKEGALLISRQRALAAASGAGAGTDAPTIVRLMTDTAGQAEFGAQTVNYGGESRARGLFDAARGRRAGGRASLLGSTFGAFGQTARGLSRAFG